MSQFAWAAQHVLLTGATGGLGSQLARLLTQKGARVTLVGRNEAVLSALAEQLQQPYLVIDMLESAAVTKLADYVQCQHARPVTGLINNAGISATGLFHQQSESLIPQLLQTNLIAPVLFCHGLLPLLPRPHGWILNVGSVFGAIGYPGQALYSASKFGLRGFTEALQREMSDDDIRIMYCAPRAINTPMNDGLMAQFNSQLNTKADEPGYVAQQILTQIEQGQPRKTLGWPEKLFVRINGCLSSLVDGSMQKPRDLLKRLSKESN